jgi:gliding motility-associated-like protein
LRKYILYLLFFLSSLPAIASHIEGAELFYDYQGNNVYLVTLRLYRNCSPGCDTCAPYGDPEYVQIFDSLGNYIGYIAMPLPDTTILPQVVSACQTPIDVCVEQAFFTGTYTLPPIPGGYTLVYQRCCRNSAIQSIPNNTGASYIAHIPNGLVAVNSSPRFTQRPPLYICADSYLQFDNSATDPDGDSLSYSLVNALEGASINCPYNSPAASGGCPTQASPPPYFSVPYYAPYDSINPTNNPSNSGNLQIDPVTGLLTGIPNEQGIFVVAVAVSEFRNGVYLDRTVRDYQFNIVQCSNPTANLIYLPGTFNTATNYGVYQLDCSNKTVEFTQVNFYNPPPTNIPLTYSWNFGVPGSTTDTSTQINPTYTYPDTGTYYVTVIVSKAENGQSCGDTAHALVEIYPTLIAQFGYTAGCADTAVVFTDQSISTIAPVNSWLWNFGDGQTSMQQDPTHVYATGGTYHVSLTAGNDKGCSQTVTDTVVVDSLPDPNFNVASLCVFNNASFTYTGSSNVANYYWNFGNGQTSTLENPIEEYTIADTVTVSLITVTAQGCRDTIQKPLVVNPQPVITTTSVPIICPFTSTQITASGGVSYTWSPGATLSDSAISNPIASPSSPTTYYVTVTNASGCYNTASVFINLYPVPQINAGPDTSICLAGSNYHTSVQLTATGGVSYVWAPATGLSNPNIANPVATPDSNQTYYVTGTDTNGCMLTDSVTVFDLNPALQLIVGTTKAICDGDTTTLDVLRQGDSYYNWSPNVGISNPSANSPYFFPDTTTTYLFTVENYCYTKSDTATIIVHALPNVATQGIDSVCIGGSVQLMVSGADTIRWQPDPTLSDTTIADPIATPTGTDTYYVTGIDTFGCRKKDSVLVYVYLPPTISIAPDTAYICQNKPVQLIATGGVDYVWTPGATLSDSLVSNPIATPQDTTTYYVTVFNIHQCHADTFITINVQLPVTAIAQTPFDFCVGSSVQLSSSGGFYYLWTPSAGLSDSAISNPVAAPLISTVYTVKVSNNCFSDTATVDVTIHPAPIVNAGNDTTIYRNTSATLNGTSNGTSYYWYPDINLGSASSLSTLASPLYTTEYYLYAVSEFNCTNLDSIVVTVEPYTLILIPTAFSPNGDGVNDIFRIIKVLNIENLEEFAVYDRWGEKVFSTDVITDGWNGTYKGHNQPLGVYVWMVRGLTYDNQEITKSGNVTLVR